MYLIKLWKSGFHVQTHFCFSWLLSLSLAHSNIQNWTLTMRFSPDFLLIWKNWREQPWDGNRRYLTNIITGASFVPHFIRCKRISNHIVVHGVDSRYIAFTTRLPCPTLAANSLIACLESTYTNKVIIQRGRGVKDTCWCSDKEECGVCGVRSYQ